MAMAERSRPGWTSYHSPHTNNCQDLGNSILLLLGLIICINIGINMVTLLWRRLRAFLHDLFHIVCEKEAKPQPSPAKPTQSPAVHLRCTMDPVKMSVTPPPTRCRCHRGSSARCAHRPVAPAPDTDNDRDEKLPHRSPEICPHNQDDHPNWEDFHSTQKLWVPWGPNAVELPAQTIHFQDTLEGRPLRTDGRSELGLAAYVYPVNPPPPSPQALSHKNSGGGAGAEGGACGGAGAGAGARAQAGAQQEQCSPAMPPSRGPALVPEFTRHRSTAHIVYDAQDVRRRLRELTREVEALSHCYPLVSTPSKDEGTSKDWIYHSLTER